MKNACPLAFHDTRRPHAELEGEGTGGSCAILRGGRKQRDNKGEQERNTALACKWTVSLDVPSFLLLVIITYVVNLCSVMHSGSSHLSGVIEFVSYPAPWGGQPL